MQEKQEIGREELKQRLVRISEQQPAALALFTGRAALRLLPLLACEGDFDYWKREFSDKKSKGVKEEDLRGEHLKAVWDAGFNTWLGDYSSSMALTLNALSPSPDAAYVAIFAAADAATPASTYGACVSIHADSYTADAANIDLAWLEINILKWDLLASTPLWLGNIADEIVNSLDKNWPTALKNLRKDLASAPGNEEYIQTIDEIELIYPQLLKGTYPSPLINTFEGEQTSSTPESGNQPLTDLIYYTPKLQSPTEAPETLDAMDRSKLVSALCKQLLAPENNQHYTFGLLGDWGVGKSTFINLLKGALDASSVNTSEESGEQEEKPVSFIHAEFNAWAYEHTANIQAGVAQEAINALTSFTGKGALRAKFKLTLKYAYKLNPVSCGLFALFLLVALITLLLLPAFPPLESMDGKGETNYLLFGLSITSLIATAKSAQKVFKLPLAKTLSSYLNLPNYAKHLGSVPQMGKDIRTLCELRIPQGEQSQTRLLFVVDDLDRCGQAGIVKTLEAVRLVLDIPQVTVIIAVDQRIALAALALHYEKMAKFHEQGNALFVARDYLAKVIHVPLCLGVPDANTVNGLLDMLFKDDEAEQLNEERHKELEPQERVFDRAGDITEATDLKDDHQQEAVIESSEEEVAVSAGNIENSDIEKELAPTVIFKEGLSSAQQVIIRKLVTQFQLSNPRQIKRLLTTYSLIRHYFTNEDSRCREVPQPHLEDIAHYPRLLCLCYLELLNQSQNLTLRSEIKQKLYPAHNESLSGSYDEANVLVIGYKLLQQSLQSYPQSIQEIEPFVLPAAFVEVAKTETK